MMGKLTCWHHPGAGRVSIRYDRCPKSVPVSNRSRRNRHILVMSPDPNGDPPCFNEVELVGSVTFLEDSRPFSRAQQFFHALPLPVRSICAAVH